MIFTGWGIQLYISDFGEKNKGVIAYLLKKILCLFYGSISENPRPGAMGGISAWEKNCFR